MHRSKGGPSALCRQTDRQIDREKNGRRQSSKKSSRSIPNGNREIPLEAQRLGARVTEEARDPSPQHSRQSRQISSFSARRKLLARSNMCWSREGPSTNKSSELRMIGRSSRIGSCFFEKSEITEITKSKCQRTPDRSPITQNHAPNFHCTSGEEFCMNAQQKLMSPSF